MNQSLQNLNKQGLLEGLIPQRSGTNGRQNPCDASHRAVTTAPTLTSSSRKAHSIPPNISPSPSSPFTQVSIVIFVVCIHIPMSLSIPATPHTILHFAIYDNLNSTLQHHVLFALTRRCVLQLSSSLYLVDRSFYCALVAFATEIGMLEYQ